MKFGNNKVLKVSVYVAVLFMSVVLEVLFCGNYIDLINSFVFMAAILVCQFFVLASIAKYLFKTETIQGRILSSAIISLVTSLLFFGLLLNHLLRNCDSNPNHFNDGLLFCALPFGFSLFIFIIYNTVFCIRRGRQCKAE